jgi:Flp pilus assembly pilin Flp
MTCPCSRLVLEIGAQKGIDDEIRRKTMLMQFLKEEQAQDLIEYTLLLAFVCLATSALFVSSGGSLSGIWTSANSDLATANTSAS